MDDARRKHARSYRFQRGLGSLVNGVVDGVKGSGGQLADTAGGVVSQVVGDPKATKSDENSNPKPQPPSSTAVTPAPPHEASSSSTSLSSPIPTPARDDVNTEASPPNPSGKSKSSGGLLGNLPVVGKVGEALTQSNGDKSANKASIPEASASSLSLAPTPTADQQTRGGLLGGLPAVGKVLGAPLGGNDKPDQTSNDPPTTSSGKPHKGLADVPILGQVVKGTTDIVKGGVKLVEGAASGVGQIVGGVASVAGDTVGAVQSVAVGAVKGATSVVGNVASAATGIVGGVVDDAASLGDNIVDGAVTLGGKVVGAAETLVGDVGKTAGALVEDGVKAVKTLPKDPVGAITGLVQDVPAAVAPLASDIIRIPVSLVGDVVGVAAPLVSEVVADATGLAGTVVHDATSIVFGDVVPLATSVVGEVLTVVPSIVSEVGGVVETGVAVLTSVAGGAVGEVRTVVQVATSVLGGAAGEVGTVVQGVTSALGGAAGGIETAINGVTSSAGAILISVAPLPPQATGIVPPETSVLAGLPPTTTTPAPVGSPTATLLRPSPPVVTQTLASLPGFSGSLFSSSIGTPGGPETSTLSLQPIAALASKPSSLANVDSLSPTQIALPTRLVTSILSNPDQVQSVGAHQVVQNDVSNLGSGVGPSPTSGPPLPSSTKTSNPPIEPTKPTTIVAATLTTGIVILFIIISYTLYRCRRRDARRLNRLSGSSSKPLVEKGTSLAPSPQQLEEGIVDNTRQSWQSSLSGFSMVQATNRDYQATTRNSGHGITFQDPFWDPSEGGVAQAITLSRTPSLTHSISSDAPSTSSSDDGRSTRVRSFISDHSTTTTASSIAIAGPGVNRKNSIIPGPRLAALFGIFGASGHYAPNRRDTIMSKLSRLSRGADIEHPTQVTPEDKRKSTSGKSDTGSTRNAILNATWNSPFVVSLFTSRSRRDRTP